MKILVISSRVPAVEKNGDQVVSFFRVMYLARTNTVEIICFGDMKRSEDRNAKFILESAGIVVHFVKRKPWESFKNMLLAIPNSQMPFQCAFALSRDFQRAVDAAILRFIPDALYCVIIRIYSNAEKYKGPIFVDMIDSIGLNFSRRAGMAKGFMRWFLNIECSRVSAFERRVALRSTRSFVVSRIDQRYIAEENVEVIPLGIDTQRYKKGRHENSGPVIAFTGNMFYQPNADAVLWFVRNCWFEIKASVSGVRLLIAGRNPLPSVVALGEGDESIEVMGRVPSVASVLNTARVAIAPMQSGSGMQFKILEAMACGVPVVTTTLGLGDISAIPEQDLLIADSPAEFSKAVLSLLKSEVLSADVGEHGMQYVQSNHSWDAMNERFATACGLKEVDEAQ